MLIKSDSNNPSEIGRQDTQNPGRESSHFNSNKLSNVVRPVMEEPKMEIVTTSQPRAAPYRGNEANP